MSRLIPAERREHYDSRVARGHRPAPSGNASKSIGDKANAHWFNRIVRIEIEKFPTREAASAAEGVAIRDENPACNVCGRVVPTDGGTGGGVVPTACQACADKRKRLAARPRRFRANQRARRSAPDASVRL